MEKSVILASAFLVIAGATEALAVDAAPYGGGPCHQMAQSHDPKTLWVGRFAGEKGGAGGSSAHDSENACFTEQAKCMEWVDKASAGDFSNIYEMSCRKGT